MTDKRKSGRPFLPIENKVKPYIKNKACIQVLFQLKTVDRGNIY